MNHVITEKQAREITGGRKPLVPVEYESAVKALQACSTLDEAKYWDNKADALAAWAKIYRSDEAGLEAKRLKLHAYHRMGMLAQELRPRSMRTGTAWKAKRGANPGPTSLLREQGLTRTQAFAASGLAHRSPDNLRDLINSPKPPSPIAALRDGSRNDDYSKIRTGLTSARAYMRHNNAVELARTLTAKEGETARKMALEIIEWLDAFEQALPKKRPE